MDWSLVRDTPLVKVSSKFVDYFLSNPAYGETEGQTDKQDQKHNPPGED